jgi:hypothetical protein
LAWVVTKVWKGAHCIENWSSRQLLLVRLEACNYLPWAFLQIAALSVYPQIPRTTLVLVSAPNNDARVSAGLSSAAW